MNAAVVISGLVLLLLANVLMLYTTPLSPYLGSRKVSAKAEGFQAMKPKKEGFQNVAMGAATNAMAGPMAAPTSTAAVMNAASGMGAMNTKNFTPSANAAAYPNATVKEGFNSYFLSNAAGAKEQYQPIGAYDGVQLKTGNDVSVWRYTSPNEKLLGAEFQPGDDSLFMFKNNQCKPECCGASFSCGGGCVCTTPQQRQYLAGRGGNRTAPEDSA